MDNAWQRYLHLASGATQVTRQRAEQVVRTLVKRGEIAAERTEKAVDELLKRSEQNRRMLSSVVRTETEKAVTRLGLASQRDVDRLERKVSQLERRGAGTPARKASKKAAKKASKKASKKTSPRTAKKTAKKAARKTARKTGGSS